MGKLVSAVDCKHKDDKKPLIYFIVKLEGRQNKTFLSADMRKIFKIKQGNVLVLSV